MTRSLFGDSNPLSGRRAPTKERNIVVPEILLEQDGRNDEEPDLSTTEDYGRQVKSSDRELETKIKKIEKEI